MLMKIQGVGRLVRDVEIKYSQSGSAIAKFSLVASKKYTTRSGEKKEETTFIDCVAFSRLAEICNQYLRKGSQVHIVGELKQENWTAQDGTKRSKHSVTVENLQMLGNKDEQTNNSEANQGQQGSTYTTPAPPQSSNDETNQQPNQNIPEIDIDEEEIPF